MFIRLKMTLNTLLLGYGCLTSLLLVFLSGKWRTYRKWYQILLINPNSQFRVHRFFTELKPVFKSFEPHLKGLNALTGHPLTDVAFQLRWVVWWKFFGPRSLQQALRQFNEAEFLQAVLQAPPIKYTREIFHTFRKKLEEQALDPLTDQLIDMIDAKGLVDWSTAVVDSAPQKSYLNTQKCLKRPPIDYSVLTQFVKQISLEAVLTKLQVSIKMLPRVETKLMALLVKAIWDLASWNQCWKALYGKAAKKADLTPPYSYKTSQSLQQVTELLAGRPDTREIETLLVAAAVKTLGQLGHKPSAGAPQTLKDLNAWWYTPHRWKDPGISLYHCASKKTYQYGRGILLLVLKSLELPIFIMLTPKYKQSEQAILIFFKRVHQKYGKRLTQAKFLGDSEFGLSSVRDLITSKFKGRPIFPNYGASKEKVEIAKEDRDDRKLVERVLGRLVTNWDLERPRHVGEEFTRFHIKIAMFCDLLQVRFNLKLGNLTHPHAIKDIRG